MAKTTKTKKARKADAAGARSADRKSGKSSAKAKGRDKPAGGKSGKGRGKVSKSAPRERKGAVKFLREVKVELSKVTWPNREELTQSTIVVFIAIVIAALYIAFFDEVFTRLIELIS